MERILLAGFGGQGILFAGKFLAMFGMSEEKQVSWLPSYGPEMRGGTANCSVILAEEPIGSPIVTTPDILIAMNLPSMDKFEPAVQKGGKLFYDSSLIPHGSDRGDIGVFGIPATQMASDNDMPTLANVIMLGKTLRESGLCNLETAQNVMRQVVPERKQKLLDANLKALELGFAYE